MYKPKIIAFTGSPQRPSKTRLLAEAIADSVRANLNFEFSAIDLLDVQPALGSFSRSGLPSSTEACLQAIEQADALIVGSPVYKGSYAGQFKHIIDLLDPLSMVGKPIALAATGGGHRHALVVEHQLRPLFGFFSALTMPTAVYACGEEFVDGKVANDLLSKRISQLGLELASHISASRKSAHRHAAPAQSTKNSDDALLRVGN